MGRQIRPLRVYQTTWGTLNSSIVPKKKNVAPAWFKAVEAIPPAEIQTREYPIQHLPLNPRLRRPHNIYRPTRIVYPEDDLRKEFFKDHPWELARPKMVLEMDGKDARYLDWSKGVRQPNTPLNGECVIQRQLWLMENKGLSKEQAYDAARREFYRLRHEEEVERRIAQEEARMVGAYFGKNTTQVGMELEDKAHERWKLAALRDITKAEAMRSGAYSSFGDAEGEEAPEEAASATS
ncbi:mitochondrial ribosomal protein [Thozetella sp. PMI_491]|nr:mitochondrial ribosomal protein [Thozetella sp. PMI_491]